MTEFILAVAVVDGLLRSSSNRTSKPSAMLEPLWSVDWDRDTASRLVRHEPPREAFGPRGLDSDQQHLARITVPVFLHGYALAAQGWFDYLSMVILLLHALIALGHTIWIFGKGEPHSNASETLTEMLVLALESKQPSQTQEASLSGASAGIRTWTTLRQVGKVEVIPEPTPGSASSSSGHPRLDLGRDGMKGPSHNQEVQY